MTIEERVDEIEMLIKKLFGKMLPGVSFPGETWVPVIGYEDEYKVSNDGRVKRYCKDLEHCFPGRILKQQISVHGYPLVVLCKDSVRRSFTVHRLVARSFFGECPDGYEVDHINSNRRDARLCNLAYVTHGENMRLAIERGRVRRGEQRYNAKLTEDIVREIRSMEGKMSRAEAAEKFGVNGATIDRVRKRITWRHVV